MTEKPKSKSSVELGSLLTAAFLFLPAVTAVLLTRDIPLGFFLLLCSMVAAVGYHLRDVIKLSLGPLSVELRERVADAERILLKLRHQSESLGQPLIAVLSWLNRMGTMSQRQRQELFEMVKGNLISNGWTEQEVLDASQEYLRLVGMDYSRFIMGKQPHDIPDEVRERWRALYAPVRPQPVADLRQFLTDMDCLTSEAEEYLRDYERFFLTGRIESQKFLDQPGDKHRLVMGQGYMNDS